jgi:hypothetical protein
MSKELTQKVYEAYLNEVGKSLLPKEFWWEHDVEKINHETYGTQLSRKDPIAFEIGFGEWKSNERAARRLEA